MALSPTSPRYYDEYPTADPSKRLRVGPFATAYDVERAKKKEMAGGTLTVREPGRVGTRTVGTNTQDTTPSIRVSPRTGKMSSQATVPGAGKAALSAAIETHVAAGKTRRQAIALALAESRRTKK